MTRDFTMGFNAPTIVISRSFFGLILPIRKPNTDFPSISSAYASVFLGCIEKGGVKIISTLDVMV